MLRRTRPYGSTLSAVQVTFRGPFALAGVFVSLLEKEGLDVVWVRPDAPPTLKIEIILTVGSASGYTSLMLRLDPTIVRFTTRFPRISIELEAATAASQQLS